VPWQVRLQGSPSLRAEAVRRVLLAVCLVQMVKAMCLLPGLLASASLPAGCDQVYFLERVNLPVPQPRPEPLHPRQLLVAGSRHRALPRESAEECS
jgi:hypothetical protein